MNRFGGLVLVVLCLVASASCLESLCASDTFSYNGVLVNAFYKVRQNVTFERPTHYMIHDSVTCDPSEFKDRSNFLTSLKIKNAYNRKFAQLFTEELNGATAEEIEKKRIDLGATAWLPLRRLMRREGQVECLERFESKMFSGYSVLSTFERFSKFNRQAADMDADYKPTTSESIDLLRKLIKQFQTDGQTFALRSENVVDIYLYKGLAIPREFKFLAGDQADAKSMLIYDLYLPFNSNKHDSKNCVPVKELPRFFKEKGKEKRERN